MIKFFVEFKQLRIRRQLGVLILNPYLEETFLMRCSVFFFLSLHFLLFNGGKIGDFDGLYFFLYEFETSNSSSSIFTWIVLSFIFIGTLESTANND